MGKLEGGVKSHSNNQLYVENVVFDKSYMKTYMTGLFDERMAERGGVNVTHFAP